MSKKQPCFSTYMSFSVSFFIRAGINTWLLVRNDSFGIFLEKSVIVGVVFSLCGHSVLVFVMKKDREGRKRKRKKNTVQEK